MVTATDKALEQLLREAEDAGEPGELPEGAVVHRPDAEMPAPMVSAKTISAGHVYIYDTRTGHRSVTNRNMLVNQLKKKRKDGSTVFTTVKPPVGPVLGTLKCLLHPDDPKRATYEALGFAACRKSNMPTALQVKLHMQRDHRVEWATIEEQRARDERDEERRFQRSLISMAAGSRDTGAGSEAAKVRMAKARAGRRTKLAATG